MIISCPSCTIRFTLDADLLGKAGRKVRCTQCGHIWKQTPPPLLSQDSSPVAAAAMGRASDAKLPAMPKFEGPTTRIASPSSTRKGGGSYPLYVLLVVLIVGVLLSLAIFREKITDLVPDLATFYDLVGLPVGSVP